VNATTFDEDSYAIDYPLEWTGRQTTCGLPLRRPDVIAIDTKS